MAMITHVLHSVLKAATSAALLLLGLWITKFIFLWWVLQGVGG